MFETQSLIGGTEESIRTDTRAGNPIVNSRSRLGIPPAAEHKFLGFVKENGQPSWQIRASVDIHYNCSGHVWANRRTCIYKLEEWTKILKEDGYRRTASPHPDDIVIYYMEDGSMAHVGKVQHLIPSEITSPVAVVLSKWGDTGGEVIHHVNEVPTVIRTKHEFWTDRQNDSPPTIQPSILV